MTFYSGVIVGRLMTAVGNRLARSQPGLVTVTVSYPFIFLVFLGCAPAVRLARDLNGYLPFGDSF